MEENTCLRKNLRRGVECDAIMWVVTQLLNSSQCTLQVSNVVLEHYNMTDVWSPV